MMLLLLLGASVCSVGFSFDVIQYGATYMMPLPSNAHSIDFRPPYQSVATVLWNHDSPLDVYDSRGKVMGAYYVISNVTQRDSGQYTIKDKRQRQLSLNTIQVKEYIKFYTLTSGERFNISFSLESNFCNIYFFPRHDHEVRTEIVRLGRLQRGLDQLDCAEFDLLKPCGIINTDLQMSCRGRFEVRDQNDNKALVVDLEMESWSWSPLPEDLRLQGEINKNPLITAIGVSFIVIVIGCCCVRCCCCRKSSDEKPDAEPADEPAAEPAAEPSVEPADEPAAAFCEYDNAPAGSVQDQLSQPYNTLYPVAPAYAPIVPPVHERPTEPPAYSEVLAPTGPADAPSVPLFSDPEPQFEMKWLSSSFVSPLSSESTSCDVYSSDKLNFL